MLKSIKTFLLCTPFVVSSYACGTEGENNAKDFVKDKIRQSEMYDINDLVSLEAEQQDSLQSTLCLNFIKIEIAKAEKEFYEGKKKGEDVLKLIDDKSKEIDFIAKSWQYNGLIDKEDSLYKSHNEARATYKVTAKFNNHPDVTIRVIMDRNGVKPYATEAEIGDEINEATDYLLHEQRELLKDIYE